MNTKTRTIFTVIGFDSYNLQVIRNSTDRDEVIFIPLNTLSSTFIDKVIKGLACWADGVLFFAKIENVVGFNNTYKITDIEEDIQPVLTWEEIFND